MGKVVKVNYTYDPSKHTNTCPRCGNYCGGGCGK